MFCSFKISSQNQRFPNDCINSKQTNKPKTKGVFSTKPICEAGLAGVRVSASCQPGGAALGEGALPWALGPGPGLRKAPGRNSWPWGEIWGAGAGRDGWGLCRWVEELKTWVQDWLLCWVL